MELIAKISKGTLMDQVYLPKNRTSLPTGSYVILKPLASLIQKEEKITLNFHGIKKIEPIKLEILDKIIRTIKKNVQNYQNIIITGSFLNKGFNFNDLDILLISDYPISTESLSKTLDTQIGIKMHILSISNKELLEGLNSDPLYELMLSECISERKFIYKTHKNPNYKLLDLHLLNSKVIIDNFDILNGKDKYNLTRNLIAIKLFLENKRLNQKMLTNFIIKEFDLSGINNLKENTLNKNAFLEKFKEIYQKLFNRIIQEVSNDSK
ncbi:MAG: hypothetical protein AABX66_02620 [Nanoarchaeota archaeon]